MWQRKQTIYLLLAAILMAAELPMIGTEAEGELREQLLGMLHLQQIMAAFTALHAVASIFTYRNRKRQMRVCRVGVLLCCSALLPFVLQHWVLEQGAWSLPFYPLLPVASIILFWLAYKGVKHDDDLVRSADRIR